MELAREVEALATGWRLGVHTSDWENLLRLGHQYGWRPEAGLDHYLHQRRQVITAHDARTLAKALERALEDLPPERRKEYRPPADFGGFAAEAIRSVPTANSKDYFAWERRWIVEEVARLCGRGAVEFRPM
jgi:hypothetical protein